MMHLQWWSLYHIGMGKKGAGVRNEGQHVLFVGSSLTEALRTRRKRGMSNEKNGDLA
jgi:hypothetical protein